MKKMDNGLFTACMALLEARDWQGLTTFGHSYNLRLDELLAMLAGYIKDRCHAVSGLMSAQQVCGDKALLARIHQLFSPLDVERLADVMYERKISFGELAKLWQSFRRLNPVVWNEMEDSDPGGVTLSFLFHMTRCLQRRTATQPEDPLWLTLNM